MTKISHRNDFWCQQKCFLHDKIFSLLPHVFFFQFYLQQFFFSSLKKNLRAARKIHLLLYQENIFLVSGDISVSDRITMMSLGKAFLWYGYLCANNTNNNRLRLIQQGVPSLLVGLGISDSWGYVRRKWEKWTQGLKPFGIQKHGVTHLLKSTCTIEER